MTVIDGTLSLRTGDDGVHADATLVVSGGSIRVAEAYEGLESAVITVSAGTLDLTTSDDAVNVSGGIDASGMRGPAGGGPDSFSDNGTRKLTVTGGTLTMSSGGDGVDVAGSVTITGGTLVVSGPTSNGNSALDVDGTFLVEGGTLLAAGSSGMAVAPSTQSAQGWVSATLTQAVPAGTVVHVVAGDGSVVASYTAAKPFTSLVYSADGITPGETYAVYTGGSAGEGSTGGLSGAGSVDGATEIARVTAGQHAAGRRGGMRP